MKFVNRSFLLLYTTCYPFRSPKRHPTVLILDRDIQDLPWEALPCFQNKGGPQPFSRVPSLAFMQVNHIADFQESVLKVLDL